MSLKMDKGFRERLGYYAFGIAIGLVMVGAIFAARGARQQPPLPQQQPAGQPQPGAAAKPGGSAPGNP